MMLIALEDQLRAANQNARLYLVRRANDLADEFHASSTLVLASMDLQTKNAFFVVRDYARENGLKKSHEMLVNTAFDPKRLDVIRRAMIASVGRQMQQDVARGDFEGALEIAELWVPDDEGTRVRLQESNDLAVMTYAENLATADQVGRAFQVLPWVTTKNRALITAGFDLHVLMGAQRDRDHGNTLHGKCVVEFCSSDEAVKAQIYAVMKWATLNVSDIPDQVPLGSPERFSHLVAVAKPGDRRLLMALSAWQIEYLDAALEHGGADEAALSEVFQPHHIDAMREARGSLDRATNRDVSQRLLDERQF